MSVQTGQVIWKQEDYGDKISRGRGWVSVRGEGGRMGQDKRTRT